MIPWFKNLLGPSALPRMLVFLFVSAIYLYAFPQANVFYAVVVLMHAVVGLVACVYLVVLLLGIQRRSSALARLGWLLVLASAVLGVILIKLGTSRTEWNWLYLHILLALTGCTILFAEWAGQRGWLSGGLTSAVSRYAV